MGEVKLFRLSGSAAVIDLRTGNNATLRPGLVVLSEDAHTHAIATLEAENAKLRAELERRESHWFSLVMNCAAELETASYCMTDMEAKRVAQSGADHYRKQANAAPSAPKAGSGIYSEDPLACNGCASGCFRCRNAAPKADDPVKVQLLEALEYSLPYLMACVPNPRNGINADGSVDVNCVDRARAAIAAARKGEGE